jgi:hypothetical protein
MRVRASFITKTESALPRVGISNERETSVTERELHRHSGRAGLLYPRAFSTGQHVACERIPETVRGDASDASAYSQRTPMRSAKNLNVFGGRDSFNSCHSGELEPSAIARSSLATRRMLLNGVHRVREHLRHAVDVLRRNHHSRK